MVADLILPAKQLIQIVLNVLLLPVALFPADFGQVLFAFPNCAFGIGLIGFPVELPLFQFGLQLYDPIG